MEIILLKEKSLVAWIVLNWAAVSWQQRTDVPEDISICSQKANRCHHIYRITLIWLKENKILRSSTSRNDL